MLILFSIVLLPIYSITIFIPYWTRKTESFGVSIPEQIYHTPQLKKIRQRYTIFTVISSFIVTILFFTIGSILIQNEEILSLLFGVLIILYLLISFVIYMNFHLEMKQMKAEKNWNQEKSQKVIIQLGFREHNLTHSHLWFLAPILIAILLIIVTFHSYNLIPNQIPTQYNFSGDVTNWAEKSYRNVLLHPVMLIYMSFLFLFINITISKSKQQIDPNNPEASIQKTVIFRRRWSMFTIVSNYVLTILFTIMQLSLIYPINRSGISILSLLTAAIIVFGAIVLSITTGQGGSRLKQFQDMEGNLINRDDDQYWKLGQFYFNKNDPSLFLEKRFGIGWTINLARPLSWIILLTIIGLAIALPIVFGV